MSTRPPGGISPDASWRRWTRARGPAGTRWAGTAALLVVREGGGYGGDNDRLVDLRVDEHPDPIKELIRIRDLHTLYFGETRPEDVIAVYGDVRREIVGSLARLGYLEGGDTGDEAIFDALNAFVRTEKFEEREQERGYLDRMVLQFMKNRVRAPG